MTFKTLANAKPRCSKCERYAYYDYQCPSENQHVRNVPSDDIDDSKIVDDVHVSPKTASIIENISVGFSTLILLRPIYLLIVQVMM